MKKKSGAAQRLVSLVLALGLIFTLAPASVFAGDEVPVSSTVAATTGEEPVVDSTEPVVDSTEPAVDGTEPAVDSTEPAVDDSEPVADSTEPAEEPAVEQDALKPAKVAASAPAALSDTPETRGAFDETFVISELASSATLYGALERNYGLGGYDWYGEQTVGGSISFNYTVRGNNLYYFVAVPDGEVPYVYYTNEDGKYVSGTMEALASAKDIPNSFRQKAQDANCDYVFRFTGRAINDLGDTTKIKVGTIKNSCTLSVNDSVLTASDFEPTLPQRVEKGGNRTVTLNESMTEPMITLAVNGTPLNLPLNLEKDLPLTTELPDGTKVAVTYKGLVGGYKYELAFTNVQSDLVISDYKTRQVTDMATVPTELTGVTVYYKDYDDPDYTQAVLNQPIPLDFDFAWGGQVRATQFKIVVDENYEAPVSLTLTKKNGKVINKTLDYNSEEKCYTFTLTRGIWNSGADIEIAAGDDSYVVNMAVSATPKTVFDAKFYIHEKGKTEVSDYTFVGTGSVAFGAPVWEYADNPIKLGSTNLDKVTEPSELTFPDIFVDGVKYVYSEGSTQAGTYDFKGWDVAKAAWTDDTKTKLEWHVDGIIVVNPLPEFSNEMKPDVVTTPVVYDGQEHGLTINYKENYPESDFKVTYEVWNEETKTWNKLPDGQLPGQTDAGSLKVKVTFEYLSETAPHLPWPVEVSIKVSQRPLTLTVQDVTILKGETPSFTVIPSAEGENTGLLTSLGHTLTDDWKVNKNYDNDVALEYTITLVEDSWVIEDADGNKVTNNYSVTPVAGKLTVKAPLPADLQPTVGNTSSTYDGQAHGLYISYPDGTSASDYKVEYQIAGGAWSETAPSLTNVDKVENVKVRFTYGNYATYEAPDVYSVEVTKRPLTLKVNDDKITDGEPIPSFTYAITAGSVVSGQSITGVTYGGYTDELGIYDVTIKTFKIVAGGTDVTGNYDVTLLPGVFTIGTSGGGGTTPTPNPNPNPTPVPVEPETPVTPVAPVTPDEEEEEPAEVEDIEDEETPQASPDTDADKEEDKTENIEDEETAQAGAPGEGNWALLNLILMALTVVAGLAMLALRFARKTGMAHLLGIVPAIVALVAFFVTEDMSLPMAMTDKWTLIMALIAVVQVVLLVLGRNGAQEDDQPREQY